MSTEILILTKRPKFWETLEPTFHRHNASVLSRPCLEEGLSVLKNGKIPLVLLDLSRDAGEIRSTVFQILSVNALIHTSVTTDMNAEEFHEAMEGLGMLPPLPADPKESDISSLIDALERLNGALN